MLRNYQVLIILSTDGYVDKETEYLTLIIDFAFGQLEERRLLLYKIIAQQSSYQTLTFILKIESKNS